MTKCVPSCRPLGPGMACTSPAGLGTAHAEPWPMFFLLKSVCSPPLGPPPLFEMPTPRNVKGTPLVAKGPHQTRRTSTRWLPKQLFSHVPCSFFECIKSWEKYLAFAKRRYPVIVFYLTGVKGQLTETQMEALRVLAPPSV